MSDEESSQGPEQVPREKSGSPGTSTASPPCPIPPEHVKVFEECCDRYQKGEISDIDVMETVIKTLKKMKR